MNIILKTLSEYFTLKPSLTLIVQLQEMSTTSDIHTMEELYLTSSSAGEELIVSLDRLAK